MSGNQSQLLTYCHTWHIWCVATGTTLLTHSIGLYCIQSFYTNLTSTNGRRLIQSHDTRQPMRRQLFLTANCHLIWHNVRTELRGLLLVLVQWCNIPQGILPVQSTGMGQSVELQSSQNVLELLIVMITTSYNAVFLSAVWTLRKTRLGLTIVFHHYSMSRAYNNLLFIVMN